MKTTIWIFVAIMISNIFYGSLILVLLMYSTFPERFGEIQRARYDAFMIGWNK